MLDFFKGNKLLENDKRLNHSIYKFMVRIMNILKADWLFYNIDYLYIFQQILNNPLI